MPSFLPFAHGVRRATADSRFVPPAQLSDGTPAAINLSSVMAHAIRIGTAGWSIPRAWADRFPADGTHLQRYAARLSAAEINSSFYRPHRRETYQRWAASVGRDFRFAVKMPRTITHERRLVGVEDALDAFAAQASGLEDKLGALLVQLPPSLAFATETAAAFLSLAAARFSCPIALEPRHPSWFSDEAEALLAAHRIARVAADPPLMPAAARPGGWGGFAYVRLHGSPRIYWSDYDPAALAAQAQTASDLAAQAETWIVYDNTAAGCATGNALALEALVKHDSYMD